ncbi:MAG: hypothetical protein AB7L13_04840 [Acidimicrobiia bacterium]
MKRKGAALVVSSLVLTSCGSAAKTTLAFEWAGPERAGAGHRADRVTGRGAAGDRPGDRRAHDVRSIHTAGDRPPSSTPRDASREHQALAQRTDMLGTWASGPWMRPTA